MSQVATKSDSAAEVGAAMGESRDMVFRYIRLTSLVPPLLDMVDEGKIALMPAERLSYLTGEEQLALVDIMEDLEVTPSLSQAVKLKDLSASLRLDPDPIRCMRSWRNRKRIKEKPSSWMLTRSVASFRIIHRNRWKPPFCGCWRKRKENANGRKYFVDQETMRGDAIDSLKNTQIQSQIFFERGSSAICLVAT